MDEIVSALLFTLLGSVVVCGMVCCGARISGGEALSGLEPGYMFCNNWTTLSLLLGSPEIKRFTLFSLFSALSFLGM